MRFLLLTTKRSRMGVGGSGSRRPSITIPLETLMIILSLFVIGLNMLLSYVNHSTQQQQQQQSQLQQQSQQQHHWEEDYLSLSAAVVRSSSSYYKGDDGSDRSLLIGNTLPQSQSQRMRPPSARVLLGIFTADFFGEHVVRDQFRALFQTMYPQICSLHHYQTTNNNTTTNTNDNSNDNNNNECELVYTFVLGGSVEMDALTEITNPYTNRPILTTGENTQYSPDWKQPDMTFLNIQENLHKGKTTTWLYYASTFLQANSNNNNNNNNNDNNMYFDYIGKLSIDSLPYMDRYFAFSETSLPPAPYNTNVLAGYISKQEVEKNNLVVPSKRQTMWQRFKLRRRRRRTTKQQQQQQQQQQRKNHNIDHDDDHWHPSVTANAYIVSTDLARGIVQITNTLRRHEDINYNNNNINNRQRQQQPQLIPEHQMVSYAAFLYTQQQQQSSSLKLIMMNELWWRPNTQLKYGARQFHELWNTEIQRMKKIRNTTFIMYANNNNDTTTTTQLTNVTENNNSNNDHQDDEESTNNSGSETTTATTTTTDMVDTPGSISGMLPEENSLLAYLECDKINNANLVVFKWDANGRLEGTSHIGHEDWLTQEDMEYVKQIKPAQTGPVVALLLNTDVLKEIDWNVTPPVPLLTYTLPNHAKDNPQFYLIPPPYDRKFNQWCIWKAENENAMIPYDKRTNAIVWRGMLHTIVDPNRAVLVQMSKENPSWLNAALTEDDQMTIEQMVQYRYQIDIGGQSGTSWGGLRWKMCTGSLVFKVDTWAEDWWHAQIEPWKHYIPVQNDLSDLHEQYLWAEQHPDEAYRIAQNGAKFCNDNVQVKNVVEFWLRVIETLPVASPDIVEEADQILKATPLSENNILVGLNPKHTTTNKL